MTSLASARAVTRITGMKGRSVSAFSCLTVAMPSSFGIMMSSSTRSGSLSRTIASAASPSAAVITSQPWLWSRICRMSTLSGTSSTTRISGGSRMSHPKRKTLHLKKDTSPQRTRRIRSGRRESETIDHSDDTVAHMRDMKIQQITEFETTQAEIAQQLAAVHGQNCFDCLQLDDDQISDQKINAVTVIDGQSLVSNRNQHLPTCW